MYVNAFLLIAPKVISLFSDQRSRKSVFFVFLVVFAFLTFLREGIGNDYNWYIYQADLYLNKFREFIFKWGDFRSVDGYEYSWIYAVELAKLFKSPKLVIVFYDVCSLFMLFLIWRMNTNSEKAIYFLFLFGFHFMMWDQIRQATSILILIYTQSVRYNGIKLVLILFSILFHISSITLIPFLFIKAVRTSFLYVLIGVMAIILMYQINVAHILNFIGLFSANELDIIFAPEHMAFIDTVGFRQRKLLFAIPILICAIKLPKNNTGYLPLLVGGIIWLLADGSLNFMRIANGLLFYGIYQFIIASNINTKLTGKLAEFFWLFLAFYNIWTGSLTQGSHIYISIL